MSNMKIGQRINTSFVKVGSTRAQPGLPNIYLSVLPTLPHSFFLASSFLIQQRLSVLLFLLLSLAALSTAAAAGRG